MSLPISYADDKQAKRRQRYSTRFKVVSALAVLAVVFFVVYGLFSPNVEGYLPQRPSWGKPSSGITGVETQTKDTLECDRSYDGKSPPKQYVVMIDAGSSGSRVHVYQFSNCGPAPVLVNEVFEMLKPGLSSYENDPNAAAKSLDPLLEKAMESVPKNLHGCTPVSVKATAGLRKVGEEKADKILSAVRDHLEKDWPFAVVEGDGISLMGGDDEGVYAWVTANYLLGNIGTPKKNPTVAVFDLGGGSTQIVFEPSEHVQMAEGDHKYKMSFGGRQFELFQHSYLGYGLNEATTSLNSEIVSTQIMKNPEAVQFVSPCLPPNVKQSEVNVKVPDGTSSREGTHTKYQHVTLVGSEVSSPLQCRGYAERVLKKDSVCTTKPCSFDGVYQPRLSEAFPVDSDLYVFSFFYDLTHPLGMPSSFSLNDLAELTNLVCAGKSAYPAFEAVPGAIEKLEDNPQWCGQLSYMHSLLNVGYELKGHREVKIAAQINNNELGWCLGASLPLLDRKTWKCR